MVMKINIKYNENADAVYHAGQVINGTVVVDVNKTSRIHSIYMRFGGLTKCYWSQTEYRNQYFPFMNLPNNKTVYQKFSRVHRSHQHHGLPLQAAAPAREYMGHKLYLLGVLNDHSDHTLQPGVYRYPFQCTLPAELPPATHKIEVIVARPLKVDHLSKFQFTVIGPSVNEALIDVPPNPNNLTKTFCCWPTTTGPLSLTVSIFQTHFVPGQAISVLGKLSNDSNLPVQRVVFELRQLIAYRNQLLAYRNLKNDVRSISRHEARCGAATQGEEEFSINLPFPAQLPDGQNVAFIAYNVRLTAIVRASNNPLVEIPISTVSAASARTLQAAENPEHAVAFDAPTIVEQEEDSQSEISTSIPIVSETPPTYDEAVTKKEALLHEGEQLMAQWRI